MCVCVCVWVRAFVFVRHTHSHTRTHTHTRQVWERATAEGQEGLSLDQFVSLLKPLQKVAARDQCIETDGARDE